MMDVNMNSTPLKVIDKKACLQTKGLFGLSKDPGPKRHQNILQREEFLKNDFMKVEDGSVHR
jgi:hypothetical protein